MKRESAKRESPRACAVLLAGGRGTRFWPRSRMRTPKQLLNITGRDTMLRETAARLRPLFDTRDFWAVTNAGQVFSVRRQLRGVPGTQILAEPVGRNTAAAIGLAAVHLEREYGDAVMAVLPADSYVADAASYRKLVAGALQLAREQGTFVVLGIPPTRPETGYGYIEAGEGVGQLSGVQAYNVVRFTEKPELEVAREYVDAKKYLWNAGMFFWRVSTFLAALKRFLPDTHAALTELSRTIGTKRYASALRRIYAQLENISVDYAVMEPATRQDSTSGETRVLVIPAEVGWSDIGSWAAVYELLAVKPGDNVSAGPAFTLDASGNYFWSTKKFVAAVGVRDMVVVETDDAVLVCPRERSQDVGKIVKWLEENRKTKLL